MSDVTVTDIRNALGDLDTQAVDDQTINLYIDLAEDRVAEESVEDLSAAMERLAVIHIAKYRVFTSNKEAFISQVDSSRDSTSFDVRAKADTLREDYQDALAMIERKDRPTVATFGDR